MKKIMNRIKEWYKKVIAFFNNYRKTSIVLSGVAVVSAIVGILYLIFYALSGGTKDDAVITAFHDRAILGMVFFLFSLFVIGISAYLVYAQFPAILNKEKIQIRKSPLILSVVNAAFQLVIAVFVIILLTSEQSKVAGGFIAVLVFNILSMIASALFIIPFLKCEFYMPAIIQDK